MTDIILTIGDFTVLSYLIPLGLFVGLYGFRSPWFQTELGVALMFQKIGFIGIILVIVLSVFLGAAYPGREWVRLVVYAIVGAALWLDVVNLRRYQRKYPFNYRDAKHKSIATLIREQLRR